MAVSVNGWQPNGQNEIGALMVQALVSGTAARLPGTTADGRTATLILTGLWLKGPGPNGGVPISAAPTDGWTVAPGANMDLMFAALAQGRPGELPVTASNGSTATMVASGPGNVEIDGGIPIS